MSVWKDVVKHLLEPIDGHSTVNLMVVVKRLKQSDGEGWAVGEMLERAINLLEEAKRISDG